jgi:hypothetical protein
LEKLEDKLKQKNVDVIKVKTDEITAAAVQLRDKKIIAINKDKIRNRTHEHTVLAHEFCHIETGTLYSLFDDEIMIDKKEHKCKKYMVNEFVPIDKLKYYIKKCYLKHEIAELFDVTEDVIDLAIKIYKQTGEW